jgi:hypothetical protein
MDLLLIRLSMPHNNHALQRIRLSRPGCNPRVSRAVSLSLGRWAATGLNRGNL